MDFQREGDEKRRQRPNGFNRGPLVWGKCTVSHIVKRSKTRVYFNSLFGKTWFGSHLQGHLCLCVRVLGFLYLCVGEVQNFRGLLACASDW